MTIGLRVVSRCDLEVTTALPAKIFKFVTKLGTTICSDVQREPEISKPFFQCCNDSFRVRFVE